MCQGAVVIDPQLQAVLSALDQAGAVPLVRGSAQQTRAHIPRAVHGAPGPWLRPRGGH